MRFQPVKCNIIQLPKLANKIQATFTLEDSVLENVENIKYLGETITCDLRSAIFALKLTEPLDS